MYTFQLVQREPTSSPGAASGKPSVQRARGRHDDKGREEERPRLVQVRLSQPRGRDFDDAAPHSPQVISRNGRGRERVGGEAGSRLEGRQPRVFRQIHVQDRGQDEI